jgi:hypothetical protein
VTEPQTSILFFLGTSESTKNRGEDCGLKACPVAHWWLSDLSSRLFRFRLSFLVSLFGFVLNSDFTLPLAAHDSQNPQSAIRNPQSSRAPLTGAELASFKNECSSNRERREDYEINVAKG